MDLPAARSNAAQSSLSLLLDSPLTTSRPERRAFLALPSISMSSNGIGHVWFGTLVSQSSASIRMLLGQA